MALALCSISLLLLPAGALKMSDVVNSDEVTLVEFYHPMCGTCTTFTPIYKELGNMMKKSMKVEAVSIEDKDGEKFAEESGALEEGIPHVVLFHKKGDKKGTSIMVNEDPLPTAKKMKAKIEKILGKKDKYTKEEL